MKDQLFGSSWMREMRKLPQTFLASTFGIPKDGLKKEQHIKKIRSKLIVEAFNKQYPVGATVDYMMCAGDESSIVRLTVNRPAYVANGLPVAFFNERSGYCCVEPDHIA